MLGKGYQSIDCHDNKINIEIYKAGILQRIGFSTRLRKRGGVHIPIQVVWDEIFVIRLIFGDDVASRARTNRVNGEGVVSSSCVQEGHNYSH